MNYTPKNEQITGSDLTGSSGTANRTYVLTNSNAIAAQMMIAREEAFLQQGVNFTFDSSTNKVTFVTVIWDDQNITIDYFTSPSATTGSAYCTTLQIAQFSGIGIEVFLENVGTGDNSTTSFDLDNGNVLAGSYTLKYAASESNSFSTLTETTHYVIDKDQGSIELTASGVTALSTNVLYGNYVYSPKQSNTFLNAYIDPASREVDKLTQNFWGTSTSSVQYFDGYESGYPQTDEPFGNQIEPYPEFILKFRGVSSITSVLFLDRQGNTDTTLDSDDYRLITDDDNNESRVLVNKTIPNGKANVKITYAHGYASVPALVAELTSVIAGIMALVNISGGSYKDPSSYTLGRVTISLGEVYINIKTSIDTANRRIEVILDQLGRNFYCV